LGCGINWLVQSASASDGDADPRFQGFNRFADLLRLEDPLVYGVAGIS
jgi:hypothetical protein